MSFLLISLVFLQSPAPDLNRLPTHDAYLQTKKRVAELRQEKERISRVLADAEALLAKQAAKLKAEAAEAKARAAKAEEDIAAVVAVGEEPKPQIVPGGTIAAKSNVIKPSRKGGNEKEAEIVFNVPEGAELFFDGTKRDTGNAKKRSIAVPLADDATYIYSVEVKWTENGEAKSQVLEVQVKNGMVTEVTIKGV